MGFPGLGECLDTFHCEGIMDSVRQNLPSHPRSTELFLSSKESIPHNNGSDEDNVLPEKAVGIILSCLPVKDVFRFGFKLSKNWLQIWKNNPLILHDAQLVPDQWKEQILERSLFKFDVTANLSYILDLHPGPIDYLRIEYSMWKGDSSQLHQWIKISTSKGVKELVLFGRWPRAELDILPIDIVYSSQLRKLALSFFRMPSLSMDDEFCLTQLRTLIIASCEMKEMDGTIMFIRCNNLQMLSLGHMNETRITICSDTLALLKMWNCRFGIVQIFQCPELRWITQVIEQDAQHETEIIVSETPMVETLAHIYLDQQTLYLDHHQIAIGMTSYPRYERLVYLSLGVRFFGNYGLDVICKLLMCFPNLVKLKITRMDPHERYFTALLKWMDLIPGIPCVEDKLQVFSLSNSGLDDTEIELAESILLHARALKRILGGALTRSLCSRTEQVGECYPEYSPSLNFPFHYAI